MILQISLLLCELRMELLGKNLPSIFVSVLAATFSLQYHRSFRSLINSNCFQVKL